MSAHFACMRLPPGKRVPVRPLRRLLPRLRRCCNNSAPLSASKCASHNLLALYTLCACDYPPRDYPPRVSDNQLLLNADAGANQVPFSGMLTRLSTLGH